MNFLDLPLQREGGRVTGLLGSVALPLPAALVPLLGNRVRVTLGVRPEHLHLGSRAGDAAMLVAAVGEIEFTGAQSQLNLSTAAGPLLLCAADRPALQTGDTTPVGLPADRLHFFDADTGLRLASGD